jgi:hypothetical protein
MTREIHDFPLGILAGCDAATLRSPAFYGVRTTPSRRRCASSFTSQSLRGAVLICMIGNDVRLR